jgi:hypothetical protein
MKNNQKDTRPYKDKPPNSQMKKRRILNINFNILLT